VEVVQRWPISVKGLRFRFDTKQRRRLRDDGRIQTRWMQCLKARSHDPMQNGCGREPAKVDNVAALATRKALEHLSAISPRSPWREMGDRRICRGSRDAKHGGIAHVGCYLRNDTLEVGPDVRARGLKNAFKS